MLQSDENISSESLPIYPTEDEVKSYFNSDDWSSMTHYERNSYGNVLHNYYTMKHLGLNPTKPAFMSRKAQKLSQKRKTLKRAFSPPLKKAHNTDEVELRDISSDLIEKNPLNIDDTPQDVDDNILFTENHKSLSIQLANISAVVLSVYKELCDSIVKVSGPSKTSDTQGENELGRISSQSNNCHSPLSKNHLITDEAGEIDNEDYGFSDYDEECRKDKEMNKDSINHSNGFIQSISGDLLKSNDENKIEEPVDYNFSDYDEDNGKDKEKNNDSNDHSNGFIHSISEDLLKSNDKNKTEEPVDYGFYDYDEDQNNTHQKIMNEVETKSPTILEPDQSDKKIDKYKKIQVSDVESARRYPRRSVPVKNYTEPEVLQDDDYIFCDACDREYDGDCPEHGPHTHFPDNYTPVTGDESRAEQTTPRIMQVAPSKIPGAGSGVWTEVGLPPHARMGPYQGDKGEEPDPLGYSWAIMKNRKVDHYIRASSTTNSNWMRFVNCARHESEQNLVAFQYKGDIYYRTVRHIPPKSELLVWYGQEYAEKLGITLKSFRDPNMAQLSSKIFACEVCHKAYTSPLYLQKHKKACYDKGGARVKVAADSVPTDMSSLAQLCEGKKVYCCLYCKYHTGRRDSMKLHLVVHSGVKAFSCDVCGKRFTTACTLRNHKRVHSGDKQYKCEHCDYSSVYAGDLKRHTARHTGEKAYACPFDCSYRTARSAHITTHIRSHTGEKPYHCPHCQYRAAQKKHITRHIARIHKATLPLPSS